MDSPDIKIEVSIVYKMASRSLHWHFREMPEKVSVFRLIYLALWNSDLFWWHSVEFIGEFLIFITVRPVFLFSLASHWVSKACQSKKPIWNAVIWVDRDWLLGGEKRIECVSGTQTDRWVTSQYEGPPPARKPSSLMALSKTPALWGVRNLWREKYKYDFLKKLMVLAMQWGEKMCWANKHIQVSKE